MQQMRDHTRMLIILTLLYMKRNFENPKISKCFFSAMLFLEFLAVQLCYTVSVQFYIVLPSFNFHQLKGPFTRVFRAKTDQFMGTFTRAVTIRSTCQFSGGPDRILQSLLWSGRCHSILPAKNRRMVVLFSIHLADQMETDRRSVLIQFPHRGERDCVRTAEQTRICHPPAQQASEERSPAEQAESATWRRPCERGLHQYFISF